MRTLTIPNDRLKALQSDILQYLYSLVCQKRLKISAVAHGFVPYHDCMTAVMRHDRESDIFLCCDMEDAFGSLLPMFPLAVLLDAGIPAEYANEIIDVCTYNGCLPQGGPASPYLLNLAMYEVDCMIASYAKKHGFLYTRYADDLIFSIKDCDERILHMLRQNEQLPENKRSKNPFLWFLFGVDKILQSNLGMHLNHRKDHIIFRGSRCKPHLLGITIRQDGFGYNADRRFRKETRAAVCNFYHKIFDAQGGNVLDEDVREWLHIKGRVDYADKCRRTSDEGYNTVDPSIQEKFYNPIERKINGLLQLQGTANFSSKG